MREITFIGDPKGWEEFDKAVKAWVKEEYPNIKYKEKIIPKEAEAHVYGTPYTKEAFTKIIEEVFTKQDKKNKENHRGIVIGRYCKGVGKVIMDYGTEPLCDNIDCLSCRSIRSSMSLITSKARRKGSKVIPSWYEEQLNNKY